MTTSELIAKLERELPSAQRVPPYRREAECADVVEESCRDMLSDLYAGRQLSAVETCTKSRPPFGASAAKEIS